MSFYSSTIKTTALLLLLLSLGLGTTGCSKAEKAVEADDSSTPEQVTAEPDPMPTAVPTPTATAQPEHLTHPPSDPRAALIEAFENGLLKGDQSNNEKLSLVLKTAGVPEASQVLVFSKTSLQHRKINPSNPRAIYFNDNCYIGYVPGGLIEYGDADPDPAVGSGLLAVDPNHNEEAQLVQDNSCLSCHEGSRTNGRPGLFIRSVFPDPEGHVITSAGSTNVGHDTPLAKRWGGWYVTGNSGGTHHRGNQVTIEHPNGDAYIDNALGSNVDDLSHRFNTARYLQPTSDIVALMVLEHQVQMHNLLTQGSAAVHEQVKRSRSLAEYLEEPYDPSKNDTLQRVINSNAERIVKHLLYSDEVALTEPVAGTQAFIDQFRANRKEDDQARSLKDFDLETRLFKYRCSYMVYSHAYELMHPLLKDAVVDKLRAVLQGQGDAAVYGHLDADEREAILAILTDTGVLRLD